MWDDFDQAVQADTDVAPILETAAVTGSADCLLDEFIWQFDKLDSRRFASSGAALKPRNIGRRFAAIATDGNRFVQSAAQLLASNWPEPEVRKSSQAVQEQLCWREPARSARASLSHRSPPQKFRSLNSQRNDLR